MQSQEPESAPALDSRSASSVASLPSVSAAAATVAATAAQLPTGSNVSNTTAFPLPPPHRHAVVSTPASMMDIDPTAAADDRARRATSVLSMDDIEAAQALEGLRSEYGQSPMHQSLASQHSSSPSASSTTESQPEPLLSLLTSAHPLISSAINGSMSAYTTSKSYSPRFKYSAEFLERNIGSPVASTVNTVGRKTGMEGGIRWALQRRESGDINGPDGQNKRTKVERGLLDRMDIEKGLEGTGRSHQRRASTMSFSESLPPYDDQRSPNYEEVNGMMTMERQSQQSSSQPAGWQARLMISTSGLGVAMSEESLRSLTYCLTWLRWANNRLGKAIVALKDVLREWDEKRDTTTNSTSNTENLSRRIQVVKGDVLQTLKQVVDIVSKYAGGALPENARNLVRRHLTSLPQRFRLASTSTPPPESSAFSSETATGAHRVLVLAQEGLDMMGQVSGVVNDTLVSAEGWCEKLGRKKNSTNGTGAGALGEKNDQDFRQPMDAKDPIPAEAEQSLLPQQDVEMTGTEQ